MALPINLDTGYSSKIIQGKVTPPDRILLLIESVFHVNKRWLENGEGEIFSNQGISLARRQVLEAIDTLSDDQAHADCLLVWAEWNSHALIDETSTG